MRAAFRADAARLAAIALVAACGRGVVQPDLVLREAIADGPIAITDVNVITMTSAEIVPHQTVLIADGRIASIGAADDVSVPAGTQVIAGNGRYLLPGLADMHVHIRRTDLHEYAALGITTVRNMWGTPLLTTLPEDGRGGLLADSASPTIYSASPGFDGSPPEWPAGVMIDDANAARSAVASVATGHWVAIKVYNQLSPATYDSIVAAARTFHIPVVGHVPLAISVDHALASGQPPRTPRCFSAPPVNSGQLLWARGPISCSSRTIRSPISTACGRRRASWCAGGGSRSSSRYFGIA